MRVNWPLSDLVGSFKRGFYKFKLKGFAIEGRGFLGFLGLWRFGYRGIYVFWGV